MVVGSFLRLELNFALDKALKNSLLLNHSSFLTNSYRRYFGYYFMQHRYYSALLNYFSNKVFFFWIFVLDFTRYKHAQMHVQLHAIQDATSQSCQSWKLFFIIALSIMIFPSGFEVKVLFFEKIRINISLWC